ncbi:hypothetical protein [Streptomyces sp. NPDC006334]|uniref:hypothetical protein n=1 Tax=Streptomyces sp. NPDC006334 TaxID=3156754 RepID=UPI0033BDFB9D
MTCEAGFLLCGVDVLRSAVDVPFTDGGTRTTTLQFTEENRAASQVLKHHVAALGQSKDANPDVPSRA